MIQAYTVRFHRAVPRDDSLRLTEDLIDILARPFKLLILILLADIRLDDADCGDILLYALVQVVILRERLIKMLRRVADNNRQHDGKQHNGNQINARQSRADIEGHDHGDNQTERRTHRHPEHHLVGVLDIRHIRRQSRYQSRGTEFVNVGKAERLNVFIHRFS